MAGLRREYDILVGAGLKDTHEWLDTEDQLLEKVPQLSRDNIKVRSQLSSQSPSFFFFFLFLGRAPSPLNLDSLAGLESDLQPRRGLARRREGDKRNRRVLSGPRGEVRLRQVSEAVRSTVEA